MERIRPDDPDHVTEGQPAQLFQAFSLIEGRRPDVGADSRQVLPCESIDADVRVAAVGEVWPGPVTPQAIVRDRSPAEVQGMAMDVRNRLDDIGVITITVAQWAASRDNGP